MPKSRSQSARSMFVVRPSSNQFQQAGDAAAQQPAIPSGELILAGRRYRLVPIDVPEEAASSGSAPVTEILTARELQIVTLVSQGRVNKQIADDLRISEWTVSTHLRRIFVKLGVDTRAAMVSRCLGSVHTATRPPAPSAVR